MDCPICLDCLPSDVNDITSLNCCLNSKYHNNCWLRWSIEKSNCALCRTAYNPSKTEKKFIDIIKKSIKLEYSFHLAQFTRKLNMRYVLIRSIDLMNDDLISMCLKYANSDEFDLRLHTLDNGGLSILHRIVLYGKLRILKYFLQNFDYTHILEKRGDIICNSTPLHFAIMFQKYHMVKLLIEKGATIEKCNTHGDCIHNAFKFKCSDNLIKYLLKTCDRPISYLNHSILYDRQNITKFICGQTSM